MNHGQVTSEFFSLISPAFQAALIGNIARRSHTTAEETIRRITADDADALHEYLSADACGVYLIMRFYLPTMQ